MTGNFYQYSAMRTNDGMSTERLKKKVRENPSDNVGTIINACLGLSGEIGEFNDMIKKWIFHEKDFDENHAKKELGDVMWYVALMCDAFHWDLDEILQMNVDKLKARYPEGFDVDKSNNRKEGDI